MLKVDRSLTFCFEVHIQMQVDGDYLRHLITYVKGKFDHWNGSN